VIIPILTYVIITTLNILNMTGFLLQMLPLLDLPSCVVPALKSLVTLTHHGGVEARHALAKEVPKLVKLAEDNIKDPIVTEPCITVIAHITVSVMSADQVHKKSFKSPEWLEVTLKLVETLLCQPGTTQKTFSHILLLFLGAPERGRAAFLAHSSSVSFLVGCLRSTDLQTRVTGLIGTLRLQLSVSEPDDRTTDPNKLMANLRRGSPPVMADALTRYGMERAEITAHLTSSKDFQKAMTKCVQDHDLYSLGIKVSEMIGRTEYSIPNGVYQDENGKPVDLGLPFVWWLDALPHCAKAIRERGNPAQRDAANILDLKYFIIKSRLEEAHSLALDALKSSPGIAFYYYAMTLGGDYKDGLRWAKKGLKCTGPSLTPYVRFGLLFSAIEHASLLGLEVLEQAGKGEKAWEEGFAILRCAFEDSKTFVAEAPPDNRHMGTAILWCTLLTITMRGSELSPELREIQVSWLWSHTSR
jgi:hypothetical protein